MDTIRTQEVSGTNPGHGSAYIPRVLPQILKVSTLTVRYYVPRYFPNRHSQSSYLLYSGPALAAVSQDQLFKYSRCTELHTVITAVHRMSRRTSGRSNSRKAMYTYYTVIIMQYMA
jgi:hypothetical protein